MKGGGGAEGSEVTRTEVPDGMRSGAAAQSCLLDGLRRSGLIKAERRSGLMARRRT